jgi:hypothetical protein
MRQALDNLCRLSSPMDWELAIAKLISKVCVIGINGYVD